MRINLQGLAGLWTVYKPAMFRGKILKDSSVGPSRSKSKQNMLCSWDCPLWWDLPLAYRGLPGPQPWQQTQSLSCPIEACACAVSHDIYKTQGPTPWSQVYACCDCLQKLLEKMFNQTIWNFLRGTPILAPQIAVSPKMSTPILQITITSPKTDVIYFWTPCIRVSMEHYVNHWVNRLSDNLFIALSF